VVSKHGASKHGASKHGASKHGASKHGANRRLTVKWWIVAAVGVTIGGVLLAGKDDICRFLEMKRM